MFPEAPVRAGVSATIERTSTPEYTCTLSGVAS